MKYRVPDDYGARLKRRWLPPVILTVIFAFLLFNMSTNKTYGLIMLWVMGGIAVSMWWFMSRISREFANHEMEIADRQMILRYGDRVETKKIKTIERVTLRNSKSGELKSIELRFEASPRPLVLPYENLQGVADELRGLLPADRFVERYGFFGSVKS